MQGKAQDKNNFDEQFFNYIMAWTSCIQWDDVDVHVVLDQHT
jgi:hypothetical protein